MDSRRRLPAKGVPLWQAVVESLGTTRTVHGATMPPPMETSRRLAGMVEHL
jgi:hypothetical protein